jgi:hypothetical protein
MKHFELTFGNFRFPVLRKGSICEIDPSDACFNVQVTTKEDANCDSWVCFFCEASTPWPLEGDDGFASLVCGNCGSLEEKEVVFIKKVPDSLNLIP